MSERHTATLPHKIFRCMNIVCWVCVFLCVCAVVDVLCVCACVVRCVCVCVCVFLCFCAFSSSSGLAVFVLYGFVPSFVVLDCDTESTSINENSDSFFLPLFFF